MISFNRPELNDQMLKFGYSLSDFDEAFSSVWTNHPMEWLYALAIIESGLNPAAKFDDALGLFQGIQSQGWPSTVSTKLADHIPMVQKMNGKYANNSDLISVISEHFLPHSVTDKDGGAKLLDIKHRFREMPMAGGSRGHKLYPITLPNGTLVVGQRRVSFVGATGASNDELVPAYDHGIVSNHISDRLQAFGGSYSFEFDVHSNTYRS